MRELKLRSTEAHKLWKKANLNMELYLILNVVPDPYRADIIGTKTIPSILQ